MGVVYMGLCGVDKACVGQARVDVHVYVQGVSEGGVSDGGVDMDGVEVMGISKVVCHMRPS